jgi:hypothetical protein
MRLYTGNRRGANEHRGFFCAYTSKGTYVWAWILKPTTCGLFLPFRIFSCLFLSAVLSFFLKKKKNFFIFFQQNLKNLFIKFLINNSLYNFLKKKSVFSFNKKNFLFFLPLQVRCTFVLSIRSNGSATATKQVTDHQIWTFHEIIYGKPPRRQRAPRFFFAHT